MSSGAGFWLDPKTQTLHRVTFRLVQREPLAGIFVVTGLAFAVMALLVGVWLVKPFDPLLPLMSMKID